MNTEAGARLGPYEIVSRIGAGGMGEVFRARDTRLDRSVAIKMLPPELAQNAQFRLRFEREARTISQLTHPNICTLFDVGDGYLVMELLEGESLADRIARGPLPIRDVLRYGVEIAAALDRAHRAGVIHRDLKPGNVMITKSGAKLLDFGLAKSSNVVEVSGDAATQHKPLTQEGTILGTFQYMAPEQLEGLEADARTDIFALGAVLYEMATGRRAFAAASRTSLIAAIVSGEPTPISQIQPLTPAAFEHVVQKCLAKDPDGRWQSAHDIAEELRWIGETGSGTGMAAVTPGKRRFAWTGWILAAVIALAWIAFATLRKPSSPPRLETSIILPEGNSASAGAGMAFSPDGRQLAFVAQRDGKQQIWIRDLGSSAVRALAGTEGSWLPFWSLDGTSIGFFAPGKLMTASAGGGAPEVVTELTYATGGMWAGNGQIVYAAGPIIFRIAATGGPPQKIIEMPGRVLTNPTLLPDGKRFLFTAIRGTEPDGLYVASVNDGQPRAVLPGVYSNAAYAPPGLIVYYKEGDLRAQPVDPKTLVPRGESIRIVDHVQYDSDFKHALFAVAGNGSLAYVLGEGAGKTELVWVSPEGKDLQVVAPAAMYYSPRLSHDEKRIAVDKSDPQTNKGDIWIIDAQHGSSTRLTYDPVNESAPNWTPDDRTLIFFSQKKGPLDLHQRPAGGTGSEEIVLENQSAKVPLDVSRDGQWLLFAVYERGASSTGDVWFLDRRTGKAKPYLATPFDECEAVFSPDGKWIAYTSNESGQYEVYVQQFPESSGKWMVSRGGGSQGVWSGDGRQIYYIAKDEKMMATPVTLGASFDSGEPRALFPARVRANYGLRQYDVTRDGSKFLLNRRIDQAATPITLVQNWTESLRR